MTPTSDKRREVAERLRHMADAHDATEATHVARALGLEYKVYGTVVAFDSADIWSLADLIDPTCTSVLAKGGLAVWRKCSMCGEPLDSHVNYCPNCGARVVHQ